MTTPPAEMDCQTLVELVTEYLEGGLADSERAAIDAHLAECDGCTAYLDQMRTTIRVTGSIREEQIPEEARRTLLGVFRTWRAER